MSPWRRVSTDVRVQTPESLQGPRRVGYRPRVLSHSRKGMGRSTSSSELSRVEPRRLLTIRDPHL